MPRVIAGADATKESLKTLRVPAIYITGDASDIAYPNAEDDFARLNHIPVFRAWLEKMGHSGTYSEPNGGAVRQGGGGVAAVASARATRTPPGCSWARTAGSARCRAGTSRRS